MFRVQLSTLLEWDRKDWFSQGTLWCDSSMAPSPTQYTRNTDGKHYQTPGTIPWRGRASPQTNPSLHGFSLQTQTSPQGTLEIDVIWFGEEQGRAVEHQIP